MAFQEVGSGFCQQYYHFFSADRAKIAGVYRDATLVTWNGTQLQGGQNVMEYISTLTSLGRVQVKVENVDCHPSLSGGVIAVVNGEMLVEGERHSLTFNDVFHLAQDQSQQWYISNQLFRILGGGSVSVEEKKQ